MFAGEFRAHAEAGGLFRLPPISLAAVPPPEVAVDRQVVVLQSLDQSLWRYQAQSREAKLVATREHLDDGQRRLLMHDVVAESVLAELDPHGRFTIPPGFRTYPAVATEVVPIGLCDRIELWCPTHWQAYLSGLGERHEIVLGKILALSSHHITVHGPGSPTSTPGSGRIQRREHP
jgi:DNA-binding transcriptional regulator/RsmH inhibitor MraZ